MGIINVDFEMTGQLLIVFCTCQILEKEWEYSEAVHQLFIDFKQAKICLGGKFCKIFTLSMVTPSNWYG
jgi:hypothetical protein